MSFEEQMEIAALRSYRDSTDNTLKEYLRDNIELLLGGFEHNDRTVTLEDKVNMITHLITDLLKWRYEYELRMQYTHLPEN